MLMNYWGKNNIHVGNFESLSDKKKKKKNLRCEVKCDHRSYVKCLAH
jgi:hypothetical protein